MKFCRPAATLALLFALIPAAAWAQTPEAQASNANKATARELTVQGFAALEKKDFAVAAELFGRADALYHAPTVLLGLARANVGLGKLMTAQEYFNQVAHEQVPPNAPPAFVDAVEKAKQELGALAGRVPAIVINVKWSGPARVMLDGIQVPSASLGIRRPTDPGTHLIQVVAEGAADNDVSVTVGEGKTETVTIELKPGVGSAPPPPSPVDAMKSAGGGLAASEPAMVPDRRQPSGLQKTLGFVGLGVGAAGLAVGGIAGGLAMSKNSELSSKCPTGHCAPAQKAVLQSTVDSYQTMGTLSTAGFLAGGALAATGAVLWLTAPKAESGSASVLPLVGLGYVGAQGRF